MTSESSARGNRRRPTINDVANACGVSKATVSKALSPKRGRPQMTESTRERIIDKARELGYRPSWRARALAHGRSMSVGLLHRERSADCLGLNPVLLRSLLHVLGEQDYQLVLLPADRALQRIEETVRDERIDGCVSMIDLPNETAEALVGARSPVVMVNQTTPHPLPQVISDRSRAMREAMEHLVGLGHRRITLLDGERSPGSPHRDKRKAFTEAVEQTDLGDGAIIHEGEIAPLVDRIAGDGAAPTGLVCAGGRRAAELLQQLHQRGVRVPEEVSVIQVGGHLPADVLAPPLTAVETPWEAMGRKAGELLLQWVESESPPWDQRLVLDAALIERASTAPPSRDGTGRRG